MSRIVFLDSDLLGIVTTPKAASPIYQALKGYTVMLPKSDGYEVRCKLLRAGKVVVINGLDETTLAAEPHFT